MQLNLMSQSEEEKPPNSYRTETAFIPWVCSQLLVYMDTSWGCLLWGRPLLSPAGSGRPKWAAVYFK